MQVGRDGDKWSHQSHWKFHLVQEALKQQFSLVPLPVTSEWMWSILILKPLHVTVWNRWFWIPVKICTFREESKDGIGCWDGCCRRQPGHHCPEDLGDVQQHHGGKKLCRWQHRFGVWPSLWRWALEMRFTNTTDSSSRAFWQQSHGKRTRTSLRWLFPFTRLPCTAAYICRTSRSLLWLCWKWLCMQDRGAILRSWDCCWERSVCFFSSLQ